MNSFVSQIILLLFAERQITNLVQIPNAALQFHTAVSESPNASELAKTPLALRGSE